MLSCNGRSSFDSGLFVVVGGDGSGGGDGDGNDTGRSSNLPMTRSIKNAGLSQSRSFGRFDVDEGVGGFLTVRDAAASVSNVTKASACALPSIGFSLKARCAGKPNVNRDRVVSKQDRLTYQRPLKPRQPPKRAPQLINRPNKRRNMHRRLLRHLALTQIQIIHSEFLAFVYEFAVCEFHEDGEGFCVCGEGEADGGGV